MKPLVIYHGNCADGFTAAWAVHKAMDADFHPGVYSEPPPDVTKRDVILVDFCYKPEVMLELQQSARSILVLDHHKTAAEALPHNPYTRSTDLTVLRMDRPEWTAPHSWAHVQTCVELDLIEGATKATIYALFDLERSGAGIAWDFFHPGVVRPPLIDHVEDRDLWRFALDGTREIQAAVFSYEYTFENWDMLAGAPRGQLYSEGHAIERKHHKDVAELVKVCERPMSIGGYTVPVASLPYTLTSDAGALMAQRYKQGHIFAACYWDTAAGRVFSLRSIEGQGIDVSEIAKQYGGGGHKHAAGFQVPRDHPLAQA